MQRSWIELALRLGLLIFSAGLIGFTIGRSVYDPDFGQKWPLELSKTERSDAPYLVQPTEPIAVRLIVMEAGKFRKENPGAAAIAYPYATPCTIVIPSGWMIWAIPDDGYAKWAHSDDGDTLAHEMLHCLRGKWHPKEGP
jgi:hypothetical protein